jgi:Coenzyme PQQ synthesis protein D (PqqD)
MSDPTRAIRLREDRLQWLEAEGEILALDEEALVYLGTNPSGRLLWKELAAGTTEERLAARLVEEYGIDPEAAARDVRSFVAGLEERRLLVA